MADNFWRGDAAPIAQVSRYTVGGTVHAGDVLTLTLNGKTITYTVLGSETLAQCAAFLAAAWAATSTFPELGEISLSQTAGLTYLDLTAATPGVPFDVTASVTGGGATTTLTRSTVTASDGPNHIDSAKNWSLGATPSGTDAVKVTGGPDMLYGMGSYTCGSWEFRASYTGRVGLPAINALGYYEYRTRQLTINGTTVVIGEGDGNGSGQMFLVAVASSSWRVAATGQREDPAIPAVDIGASGTVTSVLVSGGDVGLLYEDESTARTFTAVGLTGDDTQLTIGRRATVAALDHDRGTCDVFGTVTTPTIGRGTYTQHDGSLTTLNAYGGIVRLNHAGTVATVNAKGRGRNDGGPVIECEANNRLRTFTNSTFTGGAYLLDENKSVTLDAGGTHTADSTFFELSRLGPSVTWNRV